MEIDFPALMKEKSDEELKKYIDDYARYVPEAIEAAINELVYRGHAYTDGEKEDLLQKQKKNIEERYKAISESHLMDTDAVLDNNLPHLYSQKTIFNCSLLFGAITGAILLVINIRRVNNKKGIYPTMIFGILYTLFQIWAITHGLDNKITRPDNPIKIWALLSGVGAIILNMIFWKLYIGKGKKYWPD